MSGAPVPEILPPGPALTLAALLGVPGPTAGPAGPLLPPLWHWGYLLERTGQDDLGEDGHARRDAAADDGLTSRMFAGGRVRVLAPLVLGREAALRHEVVSDVRKQGRSGPLRLVTHRYRYLQDGREAVVDERDILYRRPTALAPRSTAAIDPGPTDPGPIGEDLLGRVTVATDATVLFRMSALTYNAHRIHYDRDFARAHGYPGLVVHGPLQALAMVEAARSALDPVAPVSVSYRLVEPLFEGQGLQASAVRAGPGEIVTRVRDDSGRTTATGRLITGA